MKARAARGAAAPAAAAALLLGAQLALLPTAGAAGAAGVAGAESLTDAWRMALQRDGAVAAMHSERRAADADRTAAERQRWPSLDVDGGYTQLEQAPILDITTPAGRLQSSIWKHDAYGTAAADLSVPLWTSGRIRGSIGAAAAGARGAAAAERQTAADVKLIVAEAYVGVFRARSALAVAASSLASLQAHAADVQVMYDKQSVAKSDLLAAQVALANATLLRLRAANALQIAVATYNRWVGEPLDRTPDLAPPEPVPDLAAGESHRQLLAEAIAHRPELAALGDQRERLEETARAERAEGLPQIALHADYNHFDNQILDRENFASVGVSFQWRLFDSGQIRERTAALHSRARAALQQLDDLRSKIALDVQTSVLNREDAAARMRAAAVAVAQAEENVRVADELYRSGLGTNTQVLEAEALRTTALTNRDSAKYDLIVSGYRLERALGEL